MGIYSMRECIGELALSLAEEKLYMFRNGRDCTPEGLEAVRDYSE